MPPNESELSQYTGLHAAAASGDMASLKCLISAGASLDSCDDRGRTPLMVAGHRRNHAAAKALIAAGAQLNALDHDQYDLLTISAVADDLKMVRLAISNGANTGLVTSLYEGTALIAAAHLGHVAVVQALIDGKAPLDHVNNLKWTALIEAIVLGDGGARRPQPARRQRNLPAGFCPATRLSGDRGYSATGRRAEAVGHAFLYSHQTGLIESRISVMSTSCGTPHTIRDNHKGESMSEQRVVLVTGAASGIGAAVCRRIAGPGARLLITARHNRDGLETIAELARDSGSEVAVELGDLRDPDVPARLIRAAIDAFGGLDQIVANAGFAQRGDLSEMDLEDLIQAQHGMPEAFYSLATAATPHLRNSDWGRIVATSSFVAHVYAADGLFAATSAAKAATESLAKTLAVELAPSGVTVNSVAPGYTQKDATGHSALSQDAWQKAIAKVPMGRIGIPGDAAALIAFLLSHDAAYITGQTIHVDGGLTLA